MTKKKGSTGESFRAQYSFVVDGGVLLFFEMKYKFDLKKYRKSEKRNTALHC